MANKFCEPMLRNVAVVDGRFSGNTFIVSQVVSGIISPGAVIMPTDGSANDAFMINSLSSGTGQAAGSVWSLNGTPTSTGSNFRSNVFGSGYVAAPPVGWAQDGDGLAKGLGAVATLSLDLTNYSVAAGVSATTTFAIGGASISASTSSPSGSNFNTTGGLSGATLATALAAGINAATSAVIVSGAGNPMLNWRAGTKLQSMVYAWASGTTLNVQTRVASAAFNATTFFQAVSSGFTVANGGSQIAAQFAGGASGAWGYLLAYSNGPLYGDSQGSYGVWGNVQLAGNCDPGDNVYIRASSTDGSTEAITVYGSYGNNFSFIMRNIGTLANPVNYLIDDGTQWPSPAYPVLHARAMAQANGQVYNYWGNVSSYYRILGKRYANGKNSIAFDTWPAKYQGMMPAPAMNWQYTTNAVSEYIDVNFTGIQSNNAAGFSFATTYTSNMPFQYTTFTGMRVTSPQTFPFFQAPNSGNNSSMARFIDIDIDNSGNSLPHSQVFGITSSNPSYLASLDNVRFNNFVPGSRLIQSGSDSRSPYFVRMNNVTFGGITVLGPQLATSSNGTPFNRMISAFSQFNNREFFMDTPVGYCDWNASLSFPTLNAKLPDGVTPWSIRVTPSTVAGQCSETTPFEIPPVRKFNSLADGARTLALNIAISDALGWSTADKVSFTVEYHATDDTKMTVSTYDRAAGALTLAPDAAWSAMSSGKVRFNGLNFTAYRLSLTTAKPVKGGTEIAVYMRIHGTGTDVSQCIFLDPEIVVS